MALKPGWLSRQFSRVEEEIACWPDYMRREAGFTDDNLTPQQRRAAARILRQMANELDGSIGKEEGTEGKNKMSITLETGYERDFWTEVYLRVLTELVARPEPTSLSIAAPCADMALTELRVRFPSQPVSQPDNPDQPSASTNASSKETSENEPNNPKL